MTSHVGSLSRQAEELIREFQENGDTSDRDVRSLRIAIGSSRTLSRQIDQAVDSAALRRIVLLGPGNAVGEYHALRRTIKLSRSILARPAETAFTLGHETQHALNSRATLRANQAFHQETRRDAITTQDYTTAIQRLIAANRQDEASANLAGWNALVDHSRGVREKVWIGRILRSVSPRTLADIVDETAHDPKVHSEFIVNRDLTIDLSPDNIEAMAQRFFDKDARLTQLGGRGTADYANYYAAWAVGQAAVVHAALSPGQPMRIDLDRLGLSRKLMEESGIDLAGIGQQTYIDLSTRPPTRDAFHHTIGTFSYVPPKAALEDPLPNPTRDAARLAAISFALPATEALRAPILCGSSISQHGGARSVRRRPSLTAGA